MHRGNSWPGAVHSGTFSLGFLSTFHPSLEKKQNFFYIIFNFCFDVFYFVRPKQPDWCLWASPQPLSSTRGEQIWSRFLQAPMSWTNYYKVSGLVGEQPEYMKHSSYRWELISFLYSPQAGLRRAPSQRCLESFARERRSCVTHWLSPVRYSQRGIPQYCALWTGGRWQIKTCLPNVILI